MSERALTTDATGLQASVLDHASVRLLDYRLVCWVGVKLVIAVG